MFPPVSDGPGQQDPAAAAKAPLPPLGKTSRGGDAAPSRGDFLGSMISGLRPVERGVALIHHGIDMIRSANLVDPQILNQFKAFAGALLPLSIQQLTVPGGGAPQMGAPPTMGQGGIPPAGMGMQPPGPPPGQGSQTVQ